MDYLLEAYINAIESGKEIDCYNNRDIYCDIDSFFIGLTDMFVLWNRCILPVYELGDHDIPNRIKRYVDELLDSNDVLSIYGAIDCMRAYQSLCAMNRVPFEIDFSDAEIKAKSAVQRNAKKFKKYEGKEFSSFSGTPYQLVSKLVGLKK